MTTRLPVVSPSGASSRHPGASRTIAVPPRRHHSHSARERGGLERPLGRYSDRDGRPREVVALAGAAGSTLVVDRDLASGADQRLVAHLAADEPAGNAALICERYLQDAANGRGRCRPLTDHDSRLTPFEDLEQRAVTPDTAAAELTDGIGFAYSLEQLHSSLSIPELRWCRRRRCPPERLEGPQTGLAACAARPVSLRETVGALESYEPAQSLTLHALALHERSNTLSTTMLRAELARVQESPIVLNRRLREVVIAAVEREQLSMSEIASRCGRVKRDRRGNESGETSWLARRIGLLAEGGRTAPTPWVHSDVLALIARRGLGVSPREVEVC